MKKMTTAQLRRLIIETANEIKPVNISNSSRAEQLKSIIAKTSLVLEEADPTKVDPKRFPLKLSDAAKKADQASDLVTGGDDDGVKPEDVVDARPDQIECVKLKPSQSSMNIGKAVSFALNAILEKPPFKDGPGGDLGAIITSDNHIMDGHHRWIASGMVDPKVKVGGFVVDFPAKQMIAALNMITVGLGITKGKDGSGGFDQFNKDGILAVLQKYAEKGTFYKDDKGEMQQALTPEDVMKACEEFSGEGSDTALDAAATKMGENVSKLTLSVPDGFPARPDMPVISKGKGHLAKAIELLKSGQVDLNEPYYQVDESKSKGSEVLLERWMNLAGIK